MLVAMSPSQQQQQLQLEAGIAAMENQRSSLGDAVVDASVAALRTQLDALRASADPAGDELQALRQVSILFLDMVGSTALAQRLDPPAPVSSRRSRCWRCPRRAIARWRTERST